jgi:uncharacterized phage protein (TIGR02218 family)
MKNIPGDLLTHIAGETTTLCTCWLIIRQDGEELGFTDLDKDITVDSQLYAASTGFTATAVDSKADLSVDNLDVDGVLSSDAISEEDILNGKYDYAEIEVFVVNYNDVSQGKIYIKRGRLGEVKVNSGKFVAELRGLSQHLNQNISRIFTPSCDAILGDGRCKVNLASYTFSVDVTEVTSRQTFSASALTQEAGYFTGGEVQFTSGANDGLRMEIKEFSATQITLVLPMPNTVAVDDTMTVIAGCDKTKETCKAKFSNFANFRGFADIPGMDAILETAGTADLRE